MNLPATTQSSKQITILKLAYNKETRMMEITDTNNKVHTLPYETEFMRRLKPGYTITLIEYLEEESLLKMIIQGEQIIGWYGLQQKYRRDQFYGVEVSRKVADMVRHQSAEPQSFHPEDLEL